MDSAGKKALTKQEMLAEAIAFQRELNLSTDRRGGRTSTNMTSSRRGYGGDYGPMSGASGSGDLTAAGTPRGVSRQTVPQNLATPEQLFGLPSHPPTSDPRNASTPVTQQPAPRPVVGNFEPMQVDSRPAVTQHNKGTAKSAGRGLVGSRWATSTSPSTVSDVKPVSTSDGMDVDAESHLPKQPSAWSKPSTASKTSNPVDAPAAHAVIAKDAGNAGVTMNKGKGFHSSFSNAALDTPEAPTASKGLLGSRWASFASPSSPSSSTPKYPDPSTLEPVYRSDDWLSDLSADYKALSVKPKDSAETQPARVIPAVQPAGTQPARYMKPPTGGADATSQHSGQNTVNLSAASQADTAVQPAGRPVAPDAVPRSRIPSRTGPTGGSDRFQAFQKQDTNTSPPADLGHNPASAQAGSDQLPAATASTAPGGILNDSAFKDWYNSQFMRRKA